MIDFALHVETGFSLNGSSVDIASLVQKAKQSGIRSLGIADANNLYGALKFYEACKEASLQCVIGVTLQVLGTSGVKTPFLAYAKNLAGYQNLLYLVSEANTGDKALSFETLGKRQNGLAFASPIWKGELYDAAMSEDPSLVAEYIRRYRSLFQDYYVGLDLADFAVETRVAPLIKPLVPMIITNRVRYLDLADKPASRILAAIFDETSPSGGMFESGDADFDLKTPNQLETLYKDYPEAIQTTKRFLSTVDISIPMHQKLLPRFPLPPTDNAPAFLKELATRGLRRRLSTKTTTKVPKADYEARLAYELGVIHAMGYDDYFLIVWDFVLYAKKKGILVGPGRGSAAGSLVSYVLGIVDVDPLEFDLYFERFLNPERITMPDIDMDFPDDKRDEVIRYVADKYGAYHVTNIIAFGTFQGKSAIREVARILKTPDTIVSELTSEVSETDNSLSEYIATHQDRYERLIQNPEIALLLGIAGKIAGLPKHVSTHAAGIIISDRDIREYSPVQSGLLGMYQTQYEASDLEALGLLKIDFLGIRNLSIIHKVIDAIKFTTGETIDIYKLPIDNQKTYQLLRNVQTLGIFQLESQGMMNLLKQMQLKDFDDISICIALFRPGPMENIPSYLNRRFGREKITYPHKDLAKILDGTKGIIVYQEQILSIARDFAGYSLGQADVLRRAVSKKKEDVLIAERDRFVSMALAKGHDATLGNQVYDIIVKFANYGFNKSHSVVYALVAYWMAYLKANYPAEFMSVLMDYAIGSAQATADYLRDCRRLGIKILPPRINASDKYYRKEPTGLRYPLLGIRNIGQSIAIRLVEIRGDHPFEDFTDFVLRAKEINTRVIESLVYAGVFDDFGMTKRTLIENLKPLQSYAMLGGDTGNSKFVYTILPDYSFDEVMAKEKELLGVNIGYHPLDQYQVLLEQLHYVFPADLTENQTGPAKIAGVLTRVKSIKTKTGDEMAFLEFEDRYGSVEAVLFAEGYRRYGPMLTRGSVYVIQGNLEARNNRIQLVVNDIRSASDATISR